MPEENQQPEGTFRVPTDLFGNILKAGEVYADIVRAGNENTISPAPAAPTPPNMTPGVASPEQAKAAANNGGPVAMSNTTKLLIAGGAVLAVVAVVWMLRKK